MIRCPSCSAEVPAQSRFCGNCGGAITSSEAPTRPLEGTTPARPGAGGGGAPGGRSVREGRFLPGAVLADRYRIIGLLGRGGMGEVYRADDLKLGQPVALKFLPAELAGDPSRLERFFDEVRVARLVTHPNVCRVYDIGEAAGQHFLSMEYVDGEDLASLLRRIGRLPEEKAIQVARQLCAGLAAVHEQGVLHRDLKPANVMLDGRGRAKITDFGLAAFAAGVAGEAVRWGTPAYMAPEQLTGHEVTTRSDIYALGLVLYELFTSRPAFQAHTPEELAYQRQAGPPVAPSQLVAGFEPAAERVILRCLQNEPHQRPSSVQMVAAALPGGDPLAAALAAGETPSPELVAEAGRAEAMKPALALGLSALAVALFALGAWLGGRQHLRAYVPLDKPPAAMVDRARDIVRELGYTEPVFSRPRDSAIGYSVFTGALTWVEKNDRSRDRWEKLLARERGPLTFWYRQSPRVLAPEARFGSFAGGRVGRWNPFPQATGEMTVSLDAAGRLYFFACAPRRFRPDSLVAPEPDWSRVFRLAGLDLAEFTPTEPRYQRFMTPDRRAAWVGPVPGLGPEVRIEAGMSEGRLVLFHMLEPWETDFLANELERPLAPPLAVALLGPVAVVLLGVGALLARSHVKRGRADRRGAARIAAFGFAAMLGFDVLQTHALFTPFGSTQIFPILGTALFYGAVTWVFYVALEPYARRIWPSMMISWSRLLSGATARARDPLVGRSALSGLLAGSALSLLAPLGHALRSMTERVPAPPEIGNWTMLLSGRDALADIVEALSGGLVWPFFLAFLLVLARLVTRRQGLAIPLALLISLALSPFGETAPAAIVLLATNAATTLVLIAVLLRFGLLALVVAGFMGNLAPLAATPNFFAWHGQPTFLILACIAALAAYGYWAATAGRSLFRAETG